MRYSVSYFIIAEYFIVFFWRGIKFILRFLSEPQGRTMFGRTLNLCDVSTTVVMSSEWTGSNSYRERQPFIIQWVIPLALCTTALPARIAFSICALIRSQVCGGAFRAVARTAPVAHAAAAHAEQTARARLPQVPPAGRGRRRGAHSAPVAHLRPFFSLRLSFPIISNFRSRWRAFSVHCPHSDWTRMHI